MKKKGQRRSAFVGICLFATWVNFISWDLVGGRRHCCGCELRRCWQVLTLDYFDCCENNLSLIGQDCWRWTHTHKQDGTRKGIPLFCWEGEKRTFQLEKWANFSLDSDEAAPPLVFFFTVNSSQEVANLSKPNIKPPLNSWKSDKTADVLRQLFRAKL